MRRWHVAIAGSSGTALLNAVKRTMVIKLLNCVRARLLNRNGRATLDAAFGR